MMVVDSVRTKIVNTFVVRFKDTAKNRLADVFVYSRYGFTTEQSY
jgi:hypothetical protein